MIDIKLHTPIGVKDRLPEEVRKKRAAEQAFLALVESYGYEEMESPMFEYSEVFSDEKLGSTDPKDLFRFFGRTGATLALRSDFTPPIARIMATAYAAETGPKRFCYVGNVFRYSDSYQGKLYESSQAGVELMGSSSVQADAEIIALAAKSLLAAGLTEFRIHIGEVQLFHSLLEETHLSQEKKERLKDLVAHRNYVGVEEMTEETDMPPQTKELFLALPKLVGQEEVFAKAEGLVQSSASKAAIRNLRALLHAVQSHGVGEYVVFDLGMVNSLNYYTGIIFRAYTYGTGYSVIDGGRYDHLVEQFGKTTPAVGFGMKVDALLDALDYAGVKRPSGGIDGLVAYRPAGKDAAYEALAKFRSQGMRLEESLLGDDLDQNVAYAKERNIPSVLFFENGDDLIYVREAEELGYMAVSMKVKDLAGKAKEEEK